MPKITYKQFLQLVATDMNCSEKNIEKNLTAIISRIYTEALRGNTVVINGFGTFTPRVAGGSDETYKYRVTDASVVLDFSFSDGGIQQLNGEVSSAQTRFRMKNGNPTLYERVLTNMEEYEDNEKKLRRKRKLQDLDKIFDKIVKQRQEKVIEKYYSDDVEEDTELDDEDAEEKENDDEGML